MFYTIKSGSDGYEDINSLMAGDGDFTQADVSSDDGFVIIHTAAITGKPRGALHSHRNVLCSNLHSE